MDRPLGQLRVLMVEDSAPDGLLVERFLARAGYDLIPKRVWRLDDIESELRRGDWDVLICDYALGDFDARAVIQLVRSLDIDVPVVIVSGTIGEDTAAELMLAGARDFITKANLGRLAVAIAREAQEVLDRREKRAAELAQAAAEREMEEARRLQHLVINNTPIVLYAVDKNGVFTLSEGRGLQAIGLKAGQIVGRTVDELYGDIQGVSEYLKRVLAGEKLEFDMTIGSVMYHLISVPEIDANGSVTGLTGVGIDVTERNRKDEQLRNTISELKQVASERRRLLRHLVTAQEQERERIAADFHDDIVQVISAVGLRIGALSRKLEGTPNARMLAKLESEVSSAVKRTRSMLFELHPRSLETEGLAFAIGEYLNKVTEDGGPATHLVNDLHKQPPPDVRTILFRIAQEAVVNARKHGHAHNVTVSLADAHVGVLVKVEDDGVGFDPKSVASEPGHMGLTTMRERASLAHGWFRVQSAPNEGTAVEFWLPAASDDRAA
jgi:PAS domain S-box-containing protein